MDQTPILTQNVDTLFSNLENFTQNEGVIGKPVVHGDKTFIPVVSVTLGYGSGNTASKNQQGTSPTSQTSTPGVGSMGGGALGLGAKLSTEAVIVIDKDTVSMLQINAANASQLMDKIPQILSGMNPNNQQQGQQSQQNQPAAQ